MTDPIRDALKRLVAADRFIGKAGPEYAQAREAARAVLAAPTPEPDTDAVLKLAAAIREVWGSRMLGAAALAEAILSHPAAREVLVATTPPADGEAEIPGEVHAAFAELERCEENLRNFRQLRADLATTTPTPPADGETEELIWRLGWIAAQLSDIGWEDDSTSVARAAALLRQLPPEGLQASRYSVVDDGAVIQRTSWPVESWAVRSGSSCLSTAGEWEIELQPSERTDEWLANHRWPSAAAAWEALRQSRQGEVGND